jgi:hypothetical protein
MAHVLEGVSTTLLGMITGAPPGTCRRWMALPHKMPETARRLIAILLGGELGELDRAWRGWRILNGVLLSPNGDEFVPGQVQAIPFQRAQIAAYQAEQRWPRQADWIKEAWAPAQPVEPEEPAAVQETKGLPLRLVSRCSGGRPECLRYSARSRRRNPLHRCGITAASP